MRRAAESICTIEQVELGFHVAGSGSGPSCSRPCAPAALDAAAGPSATARTTTSREDKETAQRLRGARILVILPVPAPFHSPIDASSAPHVRLVVTNGRRGSFRSRRPLVGSAFC